MRKTSFLFSVLIITITLQFHIYQSNSQQVYVDNNQQTCPNNFNNTNGFVCNGNRSSCTSYVTFRSQPPNYITPPNIAFLLNSSASDIGQLNNISEVNPIPAGRLIIVPVNCSCTRSRTNTNSSSRYYQHNARYRLQSLGETYFTMANDTYQGLSTCQAMINQNNYSITGLEPGDEFLVPIMCACPTTQQQARYRTRFLLTYLATWGDNISQIADIFGVDQQSVLNANELREDDVIYPFTPILVPLTSVPTPINTPSPPPPVPAPRSNTPPPATADDTSSSRGVIIGVAVGVGILVLVVVLFLLWFFLVRPSKKKPVSTFKISKGKGEKGDNSSESPFFTPTTNSYSTNQMSTKSSSVDLDGLKLAIGSLTAYKFKEIETATGGFDEGNRIKGSVFRGEFNGDQAAIKILKGNVPNDEIRILKQINHSNITRLSGYCIHEGNTYLVFEYAEKGSLDDRLFYQQKHQSSDQDSLYTPILSWKQRVQIACNIADALNYLHSYIQPPYIHKNLKSSNVLLDSNLHAKITNFGLARTISDHSENGVLHLTKHVVGTHGYLAPEYIENGAVTTKLDVFAFGVVILELLSGKPAVRPSGTNSATSADDLLFMVIRRVFEGENEREPLTEFMDSNLGRQYPSDLAYSMAELGYKCVERDLNSRPTMSEVSTTLSKIYSASINWYPSDEVENSSSLS